MKKYKIGMYGGKFMPLHLRHKFCLETAANECDTVYAILFYGGNDEINILNNNNNSYLSVESRREQLIDLCNELSSISNVIPTFIDVTACKFEDGSEDWDAETPLVRNVVGDKLDAVYSSEQYYDEYFKRAYPEAEHRLVDPPRINYPISGTKIRNFNKKEERDLWMVYKKVLKN